MVSIDSAVLHLLIVFAEMLNECITLKGTVISTILKNHDAMVKCHLFEFLFGTNTLGCREPQLMDRV